MVFLSLSVGFFGSVPLTTWSNAGFNEATLVPTAFIHNAPSASPACKFNWVQENRGLPSTTHPGDPLLDPFSSLPWKQLYCGDEGRKQHSKHIQEHPEVRKDAVTFLIMRISTFSWKMGRGNVVHWEK